MTARPVRAMLINENIGGHATVHHHLRQVAARRDDVRMAQGRSTPGRPTQPASPPSANMLGPATAVPVGGGMFTRSAR